MTKLCSIECNSTAGLSLASSKVACNESVIIRVKTDGTSSDFTLFSNLILTFYFFLCGIVLVVGGGTVESHENGRRRPRRMVFPKKG